ncbi:hypothetical protein KFE96_14875 [Kordiimonas sp. SCSIO 12603]|uniref:hypothetical protein n=1 Tax=Kordiimonas sp. SCSIO 12603 TaxID=2829596 RepID=UPI0021057154|nr:hypothetical protein [Kordiimonas sp. SCSIO 12603]UTW58091.1 hypothetical protein KFE96_14875 [Kordiimonas sp. SCSIO 12603]
MSDISGPPAPKPIQSVTHGAEKAAATSKDPKHTGNPTADEKGEQRAHQDNRHALEARDPAVSIAATAAHIRVGDELKAPVLQQDPEGRPIIETPTATFALKPSAGLKPGDDAVLKITETGKQVTAGLLARNNIPVNPPINVQLIVISVHNTGGTEAVETQQHQTQQLPVDVRVNSVPYRPTAVVKNAPLPDTTSLLTQGQTQNQIRPEITDHTSFKPPADNPDQAIIRASSQDLATLLSAQQEKTIADTQKLSDQIAAQTQKATSPVSASPDGLGPIITATTFSGASVNLQILDPAISQVSPKEVAQVLSQTPVTANDVKSLPVSLLTASATSELVKLETDKGDFIVPAKETANFKGELVRVSEAARTQQAQTLQNNLPTYEAKLTAPESAHTRTVTVQFPEAGSNNVSQLTTEVQAVHTLRAFLAPSGPRSDIRLETPLGDVKITLDNTIRPNAGDPITIIPQQPATATIPTEVTQQLAPLVASTTGTWPSLQEAFSVLAQSNPDAANALAAKTASTGGKVTNSLLFLMSALKGGGPDTWLGNKVENALHQANTNLLEALKSDVARLLNSAGETIGDWRTFVIPTDPRGDMPLIALLFGQPVHVNPDDHRDNSGSDEQDGNNAERFILEILFSVLGTVQLDGYIRERKFDLTVRTERALPLTLEHDTRTIFSDALLANNFSGSLSFIAGEEFPVSAAALLANKS